MSSDEEEVELKGGMGESCAGLGVVQRPDTGGVLRVTSTEAASATMRSEGSPSSCDEGDPGSVSLQSKVTEGGGVWEEGGSSMMGRVELGGAAGVAAAATGSHTTSISGSSSSRRGEAAGELVGADGARRFARNPPQQPP